MSRYLKDYLRSSTNKWEIVFRVHATQRMFGQRIDNNDVNNLIDKGTIIEEYRDDFPYPSVLLNGFTKDNRPLHAVIGIDAKAFRLFIITIYRPDPKRWTDNFTKRVLS
jgi:hypothetical protein